MRATIAAILLAVAVSRVEAAPLQYLTGAGDKATPVVALTWGVLIISVAVIVIIGALLAGAIWRRPGLHMERRRSAVRFCREEGGLRWLWIGVGLSTLALLFTVVWTVAVLADIEAPAASPPSPSKSPAGNGGGRRIIIGDDPARDFCHRQRDSHSGGPAGAAEADRRRCDPLLLGAATGRQDGRHPRPDQ